MKIQTKGQKPKSLTGLGSNLHLGGAGTQVNLCFWMFVIHVDAEGSGIFTGLFNN